MLETAGLLGCMIYIFTIEVIQESLLVCMALNLKVCVR